MSDAPGEEPEPTRGRRFLRLLDRGPTGSWAVFSTDGLINATNHARIGDPMMSGWDDAP